MGPVDFLPVLGLLPMSRSLSKVAILHGLGEDRLPSLPFRDKNGAALLAGAR